MMPPWIWSESNGIHRIARSGIGTPILIVPGVMADAETWRPVADAIALPNPIAVLNRRGRVPSRSLGEGYGVPTEVADLHVTTTQIGEPVHMFGWSYGGLVAIEAVAQGLHVKSLIVYEPVSRPFAPEAIAPIKAALRDDDPDRAVKIVNIDVSGFDPSDVAALRTSPTWERLCRLALPLGEELAAIDRFEPAFATYRNIDVPVTLILGSLNENTAPYGEAFDRFSHALPGAKVDRMAGQGHLAHVEVPEVLAAHIGSAVVRAEMSA